MEEELYKKGFNHGYTLARAGINLPRLVVPGKTDGGSFKSYLDGLVDGSKKFQLERKNIRMSSPGSENEIKRREEKLKRARRRGIGKDLER